MPRQIGMDVDKVESLAAQIKRERETTVAELITRLRRVNGDLKTSWDGSAQAQFEATFGDWVNDLEKYSNNLNAVHQYLVRFSREFRELNEAARKAAASQRR
ncbi:MAG: WXG100 family type VII secretion target [Chloroflexi bacterium]|nr:WXG100 family type VII secretion target [Chloroflexota bacterium]